MCVFLRARPAGGAKWCLTTTTHWAAGEETKPNCVPANVVVQFDRKDVEMNKCAVTTLESRFRVFDLRTQHAEEGFASVAERAHKATVWLARHVPQNRDLWMPVTRAVFFDAPASPVDIWWHVCFFPAVVGRRR